MRFDLLIKIVILKVEDKYTRQNLKIQFFTNLYMYKLKIYVK